MDVVSVNVFTETQILLLKGRNTEQHHNPLKKDPNLSTATEKSGIEDHKKKVLLLHISCAISRVLWLLYTSLSICSFTPSLVSPSIPSGFYLGRTLEHHQLLPFCRAAAQRGALGPAQIAQLNWLWAHFLTGLVRSCSYSEKTKGWTNKVKQHI